MLFGEIFILLLHVSFYIVNAKLFKAFFHPFIEKSYLFLRMKPMLSVFHYRKRSIVSFKKIFYCLTGCKIILSRIKNFGENIPFNGVFSDKT